MSRSSHMSSHKKLTGSQLGQMQNHLGLLKKNKKGQNALDPKKFLELTNLSTSDAARMAGAPRQKFYDNTIVLKPSEKLTQRVMALVTVSDIAYELFNSNVEETVSWIMAPNALLFGSTPFEVCLRGEGAPLIEWLLDRAGQKVVGR